MKKAVKSKEKTTKSATAFMQNKPNSPIVQMNLNNLTTMICAFFNSLTKVKNKPNQTQFKAKTNPIPERPKMNTSLFITKDYEEICG